MAGYRSLLGTARGLRTLWLCDLKRCFHSGINTWRGLLCPAVSVGRDWHRPCTSRLRRAWILSWPDDWTFSRPVGTTMADWLGLERRQQPSLVLAEPAPLVAAAVAVTALSLGYDMRSRARRDCHAACSRAPRPSDGAKGFLLVYRLSRAWKPRLWSGSTRRVSGCLCFLFQFSSSLLALLALFLFSTESNVAHFPACPRVHERAAIKRL